MSNNPKSFYNQTDYSSGGGSGSNPTTNTVIHKPDEVSAADLQPPPPYSPDPTRKSSDSASGYGSTFRDNDEQQQVGLLSQSQPFPFSTGKPSRGTNNNSRQPIYNNNSSSSNPHQELQLDHASIPVMSPSWEQRRGRRTNGDPGCCRKWCKYLFVALLIWLVLLKYSDKIGLTPPPASNPVQVCRNDAVSWQEIPRMIDFEKNVELILKGHVSGGRVVVTPLEDRHGGTIFSDIQFTPSSLDSQMTYEVEQQGDTTRLILKMPSNLPSDDDCINLNIEIRLPYSADLVRVSVRNVNVQVHPFIKDVNTVDIKMENGDLALDRWSGESIKLATNNGQLMLGSLISGGSIYIQSSDGSIHLTENVQAKDRVDVRNSNGLVQALGSIVADDTVDIRSSNDQILLDSVLADNVFIENSNDAIRVDHVEAKVQVIVKTSNGAIDLAVAEEKNNKVVVSTSSERIFLHMTSEFEGHFSMSTSNGEVNILDDAGIEYQDNLRHLKRGERRGSRNKGDLTVTNSNADINVAFDI